MIEIIATFIPLESKVYLTIRYYNEEKLYEPN